MFDRVYFAISIIFIIAGIWGILTSEIPGVISIYCGAILFALLTQFRDITFSVLLTYSLYTLTAATLPKILKTNKLKNTKASSVITGILLAIVIILKKRTLLIPMVIFGLLAGDFLAKKEITSNLKKEPRQTLLSLAALALEAYAGQYIIFDFIWRVTSRF